jgi:hypothetical protein
VVIAIAGVALTGCGNESGSQGAPASTPPTPPTLPTATPSATPSAPDSSALPLTVSRTGGFAGFDDHVLIGTDGVATVTKRGKQTIRCKLDPALLTSLTTAAQQVDWNSMVATKPATKHPDDMIVAVSSNGKTARLEDPRLKPLATPVSQLLTEAAIPPGNRCKQL